MKKTIIDTRTRKLLALLLSASMTLTMSIPTLGATEGAQASISEAPVEGMSTVSDPAPATPNVWEDLSYSGKESVPLKAKDGKFYAVKGTKFAIGSNGSSSDQKTLKVDSKGIVKVGKSGTASLVSEKYGNIEITVINPQISDKKAALNVGDSKQLTLPGVPEGLPVAWTSSNQNVVQVLNGNCVAVGIGKAKVSAYVGGKAFSCNVTVKDTGNSTLLFNVGSSPVAIKGLKKVTYEVADSAVTINKNKITGSSPSNKPVSANVSDGHKLLIYVNNAAFESSIDLKIGEKKFILPENSHELPDFKSKNNAVASISEYGVVIGTGAGSTVLSGKYGGKKVKINVTVSDEIYKGSNAVDEAVRSLKVIDAINGNESYSVDMTSSGKYEIIKDSERKTVSENDPDKDDKIPEYPENYDTEDTPNPPEGYQTITVNPGGGTFDITYIYVEPGQSFPLFDAKPEKEGYEFDYWEIDGKPLTKDTIITKDSIIIARWKSVKDGTSELPANYETGDTPNPPEGYDVITIDTGEGSFSAGEGEIKYIYVKDGETIPPFSGVPVREGWEFDYWEIDGKPWTPDTVISKDSVIRARYKEKGTGTPELPNDYDNKEDPTPEPGFQVVTIDPDEGTFAIRHIYVKNGEKLEKFAAVPVKENYKFVNWKKDGSVYDFDAPVTSDFTLYATYEYTGKGPEMLSYTINHKLMDLDGKTFTLNSVETKAVEKGTEVTPETKDFEGFSAPSAQTFTVNKSGITVDYLYTRNRYHVTANAGAHIDSVTGGGDYYYGETVVLRAIPAEDSSTEDWTTEGGYRYRDGWTHEFSSWSDGKTTINNTFTMPANDVMLTANGSERSVKSEEYLVTLTTGVNIREVAGEGWYQKGSNANITATLTDDYIEDNFITEEGYRYKKKFNYHFVSWSDGNTNRSRQIPVTEPITLRAEGREEEGKANEQFRITLASGENIKSVSMTGQWEDKGMEVEISASPKDNFTEGGWTFETSNGVTDGERFHRTHEYSFDRWSDGNTSATRTIVMTAPVDLTAVGTDTLGKSGQEFKLNVSAGENIDSVPNVDGWKAKGSKVMISAVAMPLSTETNYTLNSADDESSNYRYKKVHTYSFFKWSDNYAVNERELTMDKAYDLTAIGSDDGGLGKTEEQYKLTLTAGDKIAGVTQGGWKDKGSEVAIAAVPIGNDDHYTYFLDDGYRYKKTYAFDKWSDDNTNNRRTLIMNRAYNLTAAGKEDAPANEEYLLTLNKGDNITAVKLVSGNHVMGYYIGGGEPGCDPDNDNYWRTVDPDYIDDPIVSDEASGTLKVWIEKGESVDYDCDIKASYTDDNYTVDPSDSGHRYKLRHTFGTPAWTRN